MPPAPSPAVFEFCAALKPPVRAPAARPQEARIERAKSRPAILEKQEPPTMIEPFQSDEDFLRDVAQHRRDGLHVWWLGQSGFLIAYDGHCALIDPYLSDSLTEKYRLTDKPHVRMTRRVVDPLSLDFVGAVAVTHNHTDHLDAQTLKPLIDVSVDLAVIVPRANRTFAADRLGVDPLELLVIDEGETIEAGGFSFTAIPAAHETI